MIPLACRAEVAKVRHERQREQRVGRRQEQERVLNEKAEEYWRNGTQTAESYGGAGRERAGQHLEQRSPHLESKLAAPPHPHPPAAGAPSTAPEGGSVAHIEHAKSTSRASEGCTDDFVHRRTTENRSEGRKTNQCSEPTTEQAAKKCAEKSIPEGAPDATRGPCWERDMLRTDSCNH